MKAAELAHTVFTGDHLQNANAWVPQISLTDNTRNKIIELEMVLFYTEL